MVIRMEEWMKDDLVKDIPKEKLEFLDEMMHWGKGKSQRELMLQMLPLLRKAREQGLQFTSGETAAAIEAIRRHSNADEQESIDHLLHKVKAQGQMKQP